jgi:PEP-CTERM motif
VFAGAFAVMGVTIWGCDQSGGCGIQTQFMDEEAIGALPAGTHRDLRINLNSAHGSGESFNQRFGTAGSGSPLIPTHFQFFFNKSGTAPLNVYIDNVRVGQIPEPASCALLALGLVGVVSFGRRRG